MAVLSSPDLAPDAHGSEFNLEGLLFKDHTVRLQTEREEACVGQSIWASPLFQKGPRFFFSKEAAKSHFEASVNFEFQPFLHMHKD